jgi:hypothetical protein
MRNCSGHSTANFWHLQQNSFVQSKFTGNLTSWFYHRTSLGFRHALIELTEDDLTLGEPGWKAGYYLLDKDATEVKNF